MIRLDLVVGSNGAGKSTFVELTLGPLLPASVCVNADVIARQRWPHDPEGHSYEAANVAAETRSALVRARRPFIAETVFSHPSKLDLIREARAAGYYVALHVMLIPENLAVERVARRVLAGGHDVPEEKIRARYGRLWSLVASAIDLADEATVYDNSRIRGPRIVARMSEGVLVGGADWPRWTPTPLNDRWKP
jgi:predicted ABC-type ATPase